MASWRFVLLSQLHGWRTGLFTLEIKFIKRKAGLAVGPGGSAISNEFLQQLLSLKGQSHEIFCTRFFPQTTPPGPIRDVLGPF